MRDFTRLGPILTILSIGWAVFVGNVHAIEKQPTHANQPSADYVLRISRTLLDDLLQDQMNTNAPIDRTVSEIRFTGTSQIRGNYRIEINASQNDATFTVLVEGVGHSKITGDHSILKAKGKATTPFFASEMIRFDGTEFSRTGSDIQMWTCAKFPTICPKRGGPVLRKVIKKVGLRRIDENISVFNRRFTNNAQTSFVENYDATLDELISELNQLTPVEEAIHKHFPETKTWRYFLSATPEYLQVAAGPKNAQVPKLPLEPNGFPDGPLEVWVHLSPQDLALIKMVKEWNLTHNLLRQLLPEQQSKAISEDVVLSTHGNWAVLKLGESALEAAAEAAKPAEK